MYVHICIYWCISIYTIQLKKQRQRRVIERWGAGVETQKNVRGEIGGWGRVPFNETYAPSLSTIYDGAWVSWNFLKMVLDPSPPPLASLPLSPTIDLPALNLICIYVCTCMYLLMYIHIYNTIEKVNATTCHFFLHRLSICLPYTGWLWLVGSLKIQVSFAEYRFFYRAFLQKRPIILRSLLIEATPYMCMHHAKYKVD